jgi:hypothetical protein
MEAKQRRSFISDYLLRRGHSESAFVNLVRKKTPQHLKAQVAAACMRAGGEAQEKKEASFRFLKRRQE